jgi:hypothetical protein
VNYLTAFLDGVPDPSEIGDTYSDQPTKPTKPGFDGFVGWSNHTFPEIETAPVSGDTYFEEPTKPTKPPSVSNRSPAFPPFTSLPGPDDLMRAAPANDYTYRLKRRKRS